MAENNEDKKFGGSTQNFVENLMKQATDAGIKINPMKEDKPAEESAKTEQSVKATEQPKPPDTKVDDKKYDYGVFKDIGQDDLKSIDDYLKENKIENPAIRHRMAMHLNDVKKGHRLISEREIKIKDLEKAGVKEVEVDKKFTDFVDGLQKDFFGTYAKYQSEYNLPDITSMAKMVASGNTLEARIAQFQKDVLTPEIEKKHNIPTGTFVFDASEAWKSGTPSYEFRTKTAEKELEFQGEYQKKNSEIVNSAKQMIELRNNQMKELKEYYFPVSKQDDGSEEYKAEVEKQNNNFTEMLAKLDGVYNDMKSGKAISPELNPFVFKNVFRGVFYPELSKIDIQKAVAKVHEQYAKHGLRLPKGEMPEDMTKLKGESPDVESGNFKVGDTRFSPQNRMLKRVEKQLINSGVN